MNHPQQFGQQPGRPVPPPYQPSQPPQPPQPPIQPGAPMPPQMPKPPVNNNETLGIISCASGIGSIGLGILSAIMSNNVYGALGAVPSTYLSQAKITAGPSPVCAMIISILALVLGIAAVGLGLVAGNANLRTGAPRGKWATLGMIFGCAGAVICLVAVIFTGCASCSYCSIKDQANQAMGAVSSLGSLYR